MYMPRKAPKRDILVSTQPFSCHQAFFDVRVCRVSYACWTIREKNNRILFMWKVQKKIGQISRFHILMLFYKKFQANKGGLASKVFFDEQMLL